MKSLLWSLTAGYLLAFYSEFLFYGQPNEPGAPTPAAADLLTLWLIYALMAYLLAALIRRYRVRGLAALLVAGALYGWMLEGMVVATVYEELPFSLSFTALAWHMPIDVLLGLYWMPRWLRAASFRRMAALSAGLGLVWGFWATWPWQAGVQPPVPGAFGAFSLLTVGLLVLAYWLLGRLEPPRPSPRAEAAAWGALLLWYALGTLPAAPVSLLVLPFLLGSGWWALRRHRAARPEGRPDALDDLRGMPRPRNLLALSLWPLVAALEYAAWVGLPWTVLANVVLYLILTPGGLLAYLWALRELRREPSPA